MVTMKEIARLTNLSRCTVSNILNNKTDSHKYRPETIALVRETALRTGYVSNAIAQSLKTGSTGTIAIVVPDIANTFFINIIKNVEKLSFSLGYNLIICAAEEHIDKEEGILRMLQSRMVDGVLISPISYDHSLSSSYPYPIVCFDRKVVHDKYPAILIDNCSSTSKAVDSLIDDGATEIFFLAGTESDYSIRERHKGYSLALKNHGIKYQKNRILYNIYDDSSSYTALNKILTDNEVSFDAVFLSSNYFVYGVLRALRENAIDMKKIHFAGFEDFPGSDFFFPKFTIVKQPDALIAQQAFHKLIACMNGMQTGEDILLPAEFIQR